jgi:hypothetical protein
LRKFLRKDVLNEQFPRRNDTVEFNALMDCLRVALYQEFRGNVRNGLASLARMAVVTFGVCLARR